MITRNEPNPKLDTVIKHGEYRWVVRPLSRKYSGLRHSRAHLEGSKCVPPHGDERGFYLRPVTATEMHVHDITPCSRCLHEVEERSGVRFITYVRRTRLDNATKRLEVRRVRENLRTGEAVLLSTSERVPSRKFSSLVEAARYLTSRNFFPLT